MATTPDDWPSDGPIDLQLHDLPHASSTLEWWYVNCHLTTEAGVELSLFASFFRSAIGRDEARDAYVYAHALTWAVIDPSRHRYVSESLVDREAPAIARERLTRSEGVTDPLIRRAILEVVERGAVPRPDLLLREPGQVGEGRLSLDFDGRMFESLGDRTYRLTLANSAKDAGCRLLFQLDKPIIRHGDDGIIHGTSTEDMFYYFSPRCQVTGTVTIDGTEESVATGQGWYDHEFGRLATDAAGDAAGAAVRQSVSWDWISLMLDDGHDLTIQCLYDDPTGDAIGRFAILIGPTGDIRRFEQFQFEGDRLWTSSRTFLRYPTTWTVSVPEAGLTLEVAAAFASQELLTNIARPSFWEGRVTAAGGLDGHAVTGVGFVERSGFDTVSTVDEFFAAVGRETRQSVQEVLPLDLDERTALRLIGGNGQSGYIDGINLPQLSQAIVRPIRTIADRGGKAWRSYIFLAACDAVGGDSQPYLELLALPELVHVGSLMVDDVQDGSTVRRGGPAAHLLYGEPLAINAGCFGYFLPQVFFEKIHVSDRDRLRLYDLYFEAVRAAHVGQALDLDGLGDRLDTIVEAGAGLEAERHVRAVHRLKSAAPASCLARIGAVIGGGTDAEIDAIGAYVAALGIAFQIVDDVLNLEGFERDLKSLGEDIAASKVTMPVARALTLLDLDGRRRLRDALGSESGGPDRIAEAIALIRECGALDACRAEAETMVEAAWEQLDPILPDSHAKVMLRTFGWQVLRRTY